MTTRKDIDKFLLEVKLAIQRKSDFRIIYTKKNRDYIRINCIREPKIKEIINGLTYKDYHSGPEADHDPNRTGEIWIFGKEVGNEQICIKLKIEGKMIKCLSFHSSEEKLTLPFKT